MSLTLSMDKALPGSAQVIRGPGRVLSAVCTSSEGWPPGPLWRTPDSYQQGWETLRPLCPPPTWSQEIWSTVIYSHLVQQLKQIHIFKPSPWTSQNHTTNQKRIIKTYPSRNNRVRQLQDTSNEQFMWFKKSDPWYAKDASHELLPGDSVHFDPCGWCPPAVTSLSPSPRISGLLDKSHGRFPAYAQTAAHI